jgi:hypothetical protein
MSTVLLERRSFLRRRRFVVFQKSFLPKSVFVAVDCSVKNRISHLYSERVHKFSYIQLVTDNLLDFVPQVLSDRVTILVLLQIISHAVLEVVGVDHRLQHPQDGSSLHKTKSEMLLQRDDNSLAHG